MPEKLSAFFSYCPKITSVNIEYTEEILVIFVKSAGLRYKIPDI